MMESVVNLIFSVENIRMLVMLAFGTCGFVWIKNSFNVRIDGVETFLNKRIDGVEASFNKKIDGVEVSFNKRIDGLDRKIDNVENTIEALAFTLEKNKYLSEKDLNFISGRLEK